MDKKVKEHVYIGYGIGCNYDSISAQVKGKVQLAFLCDKKWDSSVTMYDKIPVISQSHILKIENAKVIIFPSDIPVKNAIAKELQTLGIEYVFVDELLGRRYLTGRDVKKEGKFGVWEDALQNKIYFHESIPDEIVIYLNGADSQIYIEENIVINGFTICMGNKGICKIGANTRIVGATMFVAYASVTVGEDCLFSSSVIVRTHDAHHIFDKNTHKRINSAKNVVLHDHVWIGEGVVLLPGAEIGEGSIVGTRTVTSSAFGDHVIIAGVPGKVIRENVCWSKDSTECADYSCIEECATDDALRYS